MLRLLKKIKNISADELRVRGSQALNAFAERRGWSSLTKLPNLRSLLELGNVDVLDHFRSRTTPAFFACLNDRIATIAAFRKHWPDDEAGIIAAADRILGGEFDLLGHKGLKFGDPIDWQLEPLSGKTAARVHWSSLDYLNAESVGDKKIIWELNRHQYFVLLGQAYWFTQDEKYATTFVAQLESWMDQNPPKQGINWASSLEVAFRSIAWLWSFQFFFQSPAFSAAAFERALKVLYLNARHLESYLSTYFSPNTHLTGEALGLFYLGTLLPEFREASRWRETGRKILLEQLPLHVKPDGVYFEQSSYYHRYTTDFYLHFAVLSQLNGTPVSLPVKDQLQALLDHLMFVTRPDGTTSFWGDDDGGRLLKLDRAEPNDFRSTLAVGAQLFTRGDYKFVSGGVAQELLWLLGPQQLEHFDSLPAHEPAKESIAFPDGGYFVMRDGWKANSNYLFFDCGPHGMLNCGHAHADALSFDLAAQGVTQLVDPGTFTYTGSQEMRDWFRSSAAHNTLTIDGQSSSVSAGPFSWQTIAKCQTSKWTTHERFDFVRGSHDGYQRLPDPVEHARSILFLKNDYWVLRDEVKSNGPHQADLWFHFSPEATPVIEASDPDSASVVTGALGIHVAADRGRWRRDEGAVSECYGSKVPARVYAYSVEVAGNAEILTFLLPRVSASLAPFSVREVEAIGGKAFEINHEHGFDVVMIRAGQHIETARLSSDFEWTWVRFASRDDRVPVEIVALGGSSLDLEGRTILKWPRQVEYMVAKRVGANFTGDTSEGAFSVVASSHSTQASAWGNG
ncbi:MAG TPA: alginate lyase family protein [Pyrinomonadaceae bacterium]